MFAVILRRLKASAVAFVLFPVLGGFAFAQSSTTTSSTATGLSFSASTGAVVIRGNGSSDVATQIDYTLDAVDSSADTSGYRNRLYVLGDDLVAQSTFGYNYYGGGLRYAPEKSLAFLLKKTNVPADSFKLYFDATIGNAIPASGSSLISYHAGFGAKVALTSSGSVGWDVFQAKLLRVGSKNYATLSTSISAVWGSN